MIQAWQNYQSDLGRAYPMFALSIQQLGDVDSSINPVDLLPASIVSSLLSVRNTCAVSGLTPRVLILWTTEGAQFRVSYPVPFSEDLADLLTNNLQVQAFEFVGERIKDGRLRRMLPNV
ncbi:MAG: hypothetical protein AAFR63_11765 [Cyanobacteria bacterium J06631_6]